MSHGQSSCYLRAATGLRRGETADLRWADVDLAAGVLVVRQQLVQVNLDVDRLPACRYCGSRHRGLMFGPVKTSSGEARRAELDSTTVGVLLATSCASRLNATSGARRIPTTA
jgi:integrase